MIFIPILALIVGVILGIVIKVPMPSWLTIYLGVATVAGLDSVFGGIRSAIEAKFRADVFMTGFFANVLIAFALTFLGDKIGVNIRLVTILVMGTRIFTNLSLIRRQILTKWHDEREKKKMEAEIRAQSIEAEATSQQTLVT